MTQKKHTYTFYEEIGRGGMGVVYRAVHNDTKEDVAIKVLHKELVHDSTQVERFEREARSQGKIAHPNVIRFISVYKHNESLGIVMELLKGCSLKQYAKHHGALSTVEGYSIFILLSSSTTRAFPPFCNAPNKIASAKGFLISS